MRFNFYERLSHENKKRYDRMLETHYILTKCDECSFLESDENGKITLSSSFMLSIQQAKQLWGMDSSYYPQGSVSANRHYYEAIRNYLGGKYPQEHEYNLLRQSIINFLRLRRDDSSSNKSWLFGSSYQTLTTTSGRELRKYRSVEVSLRHTAAALWILLEEFQSENLNNILKKSIKAFLERAISFTDKNEDWNNDLFKHLTIAAISKTCDTIISKFPKEETINNTAKEVKEKALDILFEEECCEYTLDGGIIWKMPDVEEQKIAVYEYFLDLFALAMIPWFLGDSRTQLVVKNIINNKVPSGHGYGIPIHPIVTHGKDESIYPDFGSSSAVLYLLWFSLENNIGDEDWQEYCRKNFFWLIDFCTSAYDKEQYYLLPYSENNSKVLFFPRFDLNKQRIKEIDKYINELKKEIYKELIKRSGKLQKGLQNISNPSGMNHIINLIGMWNISDHWKSPSKWITDRDFGPLGDFAGQFTGGLLKSLST